MTNGSKLTLMCMCAYGVYLQSNQKKRCSQKTKIATERPHAYFAAQISSLRWTFIPAQYNGIKIKIFWRRKAVSLLFSIICLRTSITEHRVRMKYKKLGRLFFFLVWRGKKPKRSGWIVRCNKLRSSGVNNFSFSGKSGAIPDALIHTQHTYHFFHSIKENNRSEI